MEFTYKELRSFAVDFAYYIHIQKLGYCSSEKHKQLFDEWVNQKLPNEDIGGRSELLLAFANALNEECGFPLNSEGFEDFITDFLSKQ